MKQSKTFASGFPVEEAIETLRQQLAEKDAEIERLNSKLQKQALDCIAADGQAFDSWQQLAASQAREQQLLEKVHLALTVNYSREFADNRAAILQEALALPQDTSALEAMIAKAGEVMRERCAKHLESCAQSFAEEYGHDDLGCLSFGSGAAAELRMNTFNGWMEDADAIRALPGVTLEDIK